MYIGDVKANFMLDKIYICNVFTFFLVTAWCMSEREKEKEKAIASCVSVYQVKLFSHENESYHKVTSS